MRAGAMLASELIIIENANVIGPFAMAFSGALDISTDASAAIHIPELSSTLLDKANSGDFAGLKQAAYPLIESFRSHQVFSDYDCFHFLFLSGYLVTWFNLNIIHCRTMSSKIV
jgi:hypothetical protein